MMFAGAPLALGVALYAFTRNLGRPYALAALIIGGLEALVLASLLVLALFIS